MATTIHASGPCRLQIADGPSDHWSVSRPFPKEIQATILHLRKLHPGGGPNTLLAELKRDVYWGNQPLPSRARIATLLKQAGLTRRYQPHHDLLQPPRTSPSTPHQEWQMDAQGIMRVEGVGKVSLITIVDVVSRLKAESYPSLETTNPALSDYQLSLRRAFLTHGFPQVLTLDHGTVFYDNTTPSPFPTRLHLWLLALGVQVRFTRKRCPTDHAIIERTHQTMTAQALLGQTYASHADLWAAPDERRDALNQHVPSRVLSHQAPMPRLPSRHAFGTHVSTGMGRRLAVSGERVDLSSSVPLVPPYSQQWVLLLGRLFLLPGQAGCPSRCGYSL